MEGPKRIYIAPDVALMRMFHIKENEDDIEYTRADLVRELVE